MNDKAWEDGARRLAGYATEKCMVRCPCGLELRVVGAVLTGEIIREHACRGAVAYPVGVASKGDRRGRA